MGNQEIIPMIALYKDNAILNACIPLLQYVEHIEQVNTHQELRELRHQVLMHVKKFEQQILTANLPKKKTSDVSYMLCAVLDEFVLNSSRDQVYLWGAHSLLSILHNDTRGGEKFFTILHRFSEEPSLYVEILEFILVCLSIGFMGQYRLEENGQKQIEKIRQKLLHIIQLSRKDRKTIEPAIHRIQRKRLKDKKFWLIFLLSVSGTVLLIFGLFKGILFYQSNTVTKTLRQLAHTQRISSVYQKDMQ